MAGKVSVLFGLLLSSAFAFAQVQMGGAYASEVNLIVRVVDPNDRPFGDTTLVQLYNDDGNPIADAMTSESNNSVEFRGLNPGNYQVEVSGVSIENTRSEVFTILAGEHFYRESVHIRPKLAPPGSNPGAKGSVSTIDLNIPADARQEYQDAVAALKQSNFTASRDLFTKAVTSYPKYAAAYDGLAVVAAHNGDFAKSREYLQKSIHADPHDEGACIFLGKIDYHNQNFAAAESDWKQAVTAAPMNPEALILLANVQFRQGKYDDAVNTAKLVIPDPKNQFAALAHLVAGSAFDAKKDWKNAEQQYKLYLKEAPKGPAAQAAKQRMENDKKQQEK